MYVNRGWKASSLVGPFPLTIVTVVSAAWSPQRLPTPTAGIS